MTSHTLVQTALEKRIRAHIDQHGVFAEPIVTALLGFVADQLIDGEQVSRRVDSIACSMHYARLLTTDRRAAYDQLNERGGDTTEAELRAEQFDQQAQREIRDLIDAALRGELEA